MSARLPYLGARAKLEHDRWLSSLPLDGKLQFDDLITLEHTKCKPLSVCVAATTDERFILGFGVARIPASGPLAAIARKKFGKRVEQSRQSRRTLFQSLTHCAAPQTHFESDGHSHYDWLVRRFYHNDMIVEQLMKKVAREVAAEK